MRRCILITGFEPFAVHGRNPSGEVVHALSSDANGSDLFSQVLPVEYTAASRKLEHWITQLNPRAWIGFGLHQRATDITLERLAFNLDDASIPDNAGDLRRGHEIEPGGLKSYRSTLPLSAIQMQLAQLKIPSSYSDNAGRFVCNHVFYTAMALLQRLNSDAQAGFIHLPWPSDWPGLSPVGHSITLETMTQAARACLTQF